ncbi:VanZ family protein [uncultured Oscillibacter sp.]|uniref:VanZ family protein n=1 Tax=uncultured Oscillibacter sp. TaxID=876091 RepID=UPI00272B5755|nr:VanZ family protein [uncultured Oscillibacter sp.]
MHDFIGLIFYVFRRAIPPALIGLAAGAALLVPLDRRRRREGARFPWGQAAAILLLLCYLGGLAAVTLMDRMGGGIRMRIQLRPFLAFWEAWNVFALQAWLNPLLNIAMLLPLGVLLPLSVKRFQRWYWMLAAGAGASFLIEALQYSLDRGQADVDDLICNTLGAMLGYCLCMLVVSLKGKRWKCAGAYAVLPVLSIAVLAGVGLAYRLQPYGNLADAPIYAANTKGVEWVRECVLSNEPGPSGVYWAEPFTKKSCDAFAVEFIERLGVEADLGSPDVDVNYYDNIAAYTDHRTYSLWVSYKDCSYHYTDYRVDNDLRHIEKGGTGTERELRSALEKLGIDVPSAASFVVVNREKGEYAFRAESVMEDGVLTDGELACRAAEDGVLFRVDNVLSVSTLQGDAAVISPEEAYHRLCAGRFSWRDVPMFDELSPKRVRVTACDLQYLTDSKGFRQPVYSFTLSDDRDAERGGSGWSTFVPALA